MSGPWMSAASRFAGYRRGRGELGDGQASDNTCRQVLRELARIAHDSGTAQVGVVRLADNLGLSRRTVRYALTRLQRDGWIVQAVRGTGNPHNAAPRESVWVLRQLPDANGARLPADDFVAASRVLYLATRRWRRLDKRSRELVTAAWHADPVDNSPAGGLLGASRGPTRGKPLPHTSQGEIQDKPAGRTHPRAAARARQRMRLVVDEA